VQYIVYDREVIKSSSLSIEIEEQPSLKQRKVTLRFREGA